MSAGGQTSQQPPAVVGGFHGAPTSMPSGVPHSYGSVVTTSTNVQAQPHMAATSQAGYNNHQVKTNSKAFKTLFLNCKYIQSFL